MTNFNETYGELKMPDGSGYTKDSRQTGLNNNVVVVGPSGCGKSSVMGVLNALNCGGSCLISDPKGGLYRSISGTLRKKGYEVLKLDLTHPENSMHYNPLHYIKNTSDIQKLSNIMFNGVEHNNGRKEGNYDHYWENAALSLLNGLIGYMYENNDPEISITKLLEQLQRLEPVSSDDDGARRPQKPIYQEFYLHNQKYKRKGQISWAYAQFDQFMTLAGKTFSCVKSTMAALVNKLYNDELKELYRGGDFDFTRMGREKIALFVIVSDSDRSKDMLAEMFYSQAMNELCDYADNQCEGGRLPMSVTFIMDDFATNCRIEDFENIISNIRARNISAIIMIQSLGQLEIGYGLSHKTILNNCDTMIFMGANSTKDADFFAVKANKPVHTMLETPLYSSWIFRRCEKPRFVKNIDPNEYLKEINRQLPDTREANEECV